MAIVIGVTGSMGCGKSYFTSLFDSKHFDILLTDEISKNFLKNPYIKETIVNRFSSSILETNGSIDRTKLGSIVFNNNEDLQFLNNLLHPMVTDHIKEKIRLINKNLIIESALLFESELNSLCHLTICIQSDLKIAINRVKSRGTYLAEKEIKEIIKSQNKSNQFLGKSDIIIMNNSSKVLLEHKFGRLCLLLKELKNEFY